jgi:flavoprotein
VANNVVKSIPLSQLIATAGKAVYQSVAKSVSDGGSVSAEKDVRADRLKICMNCPHFGVEVRSGRGIIKYIGCGKCGCVVTFKTMLANEHCPIGKW